MRRIFNTKLDKYRTSKSIWSSTPRDEYKGLFQVPYKFMPGKPKLTVMSSGPHNPEDITYEFKKWEHVSVSLAMRCPSWDEMCFVKDLFWDEEEMVVQFHPPKSKYVNNFKYCLHLWRSVFTDIPLPPKISV